MKGTEKCNQEWDELTQTSQRLFYEGNRHKVGFVGSNTTLTQKIPIRKVQQKKL